MVLPYGEPVRVIAYFSPEFGVSEDLPQYSGGLGVPAADPRKGAGDVEHRLRQEIVLGVGGVRLLAELGVDADVFHSNEGHAGFLTLERVRRAIVDDGLSFDDAIERVRAGGIFTTHTPVPAGIDRFPRELMEKYFGGWAAECGIDVDRLMALGHFPDEPPDAPFNMAVLGLRMAGRANAVSQLHARVSRPHVAAAHVSID